MLLPSDHLARSRNRHGGIFRATEGRPKSKPLTIFRRLSSNLSIDWNSVFVPAIGLAEIIVRGSLMYLGLFVILRVMARRQAGHFGPADLLVIVLIADAAQNGLGKDYGSVTEGLTLVLTIVAWEYLLDWISWRFPWTRPTSLLQASLLFVTDALFPRICVRK